jgi:menaquinone-specific isochorismate synthase
MTAALAAVAAAPATASRAEVLTAGLTAARAAGDRLWRIVLAAPPVAPGALLTAAAAADIAVLWEPRDRAGEAGPDGEWTLAGAGAAAELRASGEQRTETIATAARAVWSRVDGATVATAGGVAHVDGAALAGLGAPPLRFIGGLSFAPGGWGDDWAAFGDAWFVLPRWTYARRGPAGDGWLVLTVTAADAGDDSRWLAELADIDNALATPIAAPAPGRLLALREPDDASWRRQIDAIRAAIAGGRLSKVVAARASVVEVGDTIDPSQVLAQLAERHPDCTRFAVRAAGATFAGATPERLVRQRGRAVETDALAGSIARPGARGGDRPSPADDDAAAQVLLASAKDRWEHDLVVRAIASTLAPRCVELEVPATPSVHALRHVLHMHTPVVGRLAAAGHVLDLVGALHPTPAVGGTPTADAVAWIASHEEPRGWYASPVGWFDGAGDGDFAVAIRSGLIAGQRAVVWAGAGIVRDSDADAELAEVRLKQRAVLGALGVL